MNKKLLTLLLVVFIDLIGFGIVIPILPLLVTQIGGGTILVGAIIASFSLFQFLFGPILGRLSDKYGRRPVLIISSLLNSLSYFLVFFFPQLWVLFVARMLAGIGSSNISVAQAYIADSSEAHERTKALGMMGAIFGLGFIVGPLLGGVASQQFSISAAFSIPAVFSLLNAFLIYFILPESNKTLQKHIKIEFFNYKIAKEVMKPKNIAFLILLFMFVNFSLSLIIGVFSLLGHQKFGWNEGQNGLYFGLIGLSSFTTQMFLIRQLIKKLSEVQMIKLGLIVFSISIVVMGLSPWQWLVILMGATTPFAVSLMMINTQALISLESKPEEQGIVLGTTQSFGSLGMVFGPLLGGAIGSFNLSLPFVLSGIMTLGILFFGRGYLTFIHNERNG
ncbi:MAG: MFS transporter, partial [Candidatus Levybacteria bacterium]|nr:MFS transporter [Candidatus Levybacteria bacterium]